jgi:hypothetical protein
MSGSGHAGLWTEPKYPGDSVRCLLLIRGSEIGDIRIQQYTETGSVRVGVFLPGDHVCLPGDTPKTEPDKSVWCSTKPAADAAFDEYVQAAYADGWQNFNRETGKAA